MYKSEINTKEGLVTVDTQSWDVGIYNCTMISQEGAILGYKKTSLTH
jgi:hypothetical protein